MAIKTYTEQLEAVQSLIAQIEATPNTQVAILGRTFTKHDLATLYAREERLRPLAATETRGNVVKIQRAVPL
ncbi:MAG: hypothetical protein JWO05_1156 [Gemmatimonadetes bacterium]|nr:hypothetical protein [Gemmatimonadota bacterium]